MVKTSPDAEAINNSNVKYIRWRFQRGGCTISKRRNTHKRAAAPQQATDHGDRGARGSSGSRSAMVQGAAASSRNTAVMCVCARGGNFAA